MYARYRGRRLRLEAKWIAVVDWRGPNYGSWDAGEIGSSDSAGHSALRPGTSEIRFLRRWYPRIRNSGKRRNYKDSITCVIRMVTSSEASTPSDHESRSENRPSESSDAPEPRARGDRAEYAFAAEELARGVRGLEDTVGEEHDGVSGIEHEALLLVVHVLHHPEEEAHGGELHRTAVGLDEDLIGMARRCNSASRGSPCR